MHHILFIILFKVHFSSSFVLWWYDDFWCDEIIVVLFQTYTKCEMYCTVWIELNCIEVYLDSEFNCKCAFMEGTLVSNFYYKALELFNVLIIILLYVFATQKVK